MDEEVKIQLSYRLRDEKGNITYSGAILFDENEFKSLDRRTIDDLKQEKYLAYKEVVEAPKPVVDKAKELAAIIDQIAILTQEKAILEESIAKETK